MSEWQPGDLLMVRLDDETEVPVVVQNDGFLRSASGCYYDPILPTRPLVVIDPEDRAQVERLAEAIPDCGEPVNHCDPQQCMSLSCWIDRVQAALREFANPTPPKPEEPSDPTARVTDHRENIWRLLADGDWVCTSGPDIGEYIKWDRLAAERGPLDVLNVEVTL